MLTQDQHDRLTGQLYASAAGDQPWIALLEQMSLQFRNTACVLAVVDTRNRVLGAQSYGSSTGSPTEYYASEVFANDPRSPYLLNVRPGEVYYDHKLFDAETMFRNRWCQESIALLKVKHQMGVKASLPGGASATLALLSSEREGHATQEAISAFERLSGHIQQACALGHVIETGVGTRELLLEAIAARADGVILLGSSGAMTFANEAARSILLAGDGLAYAMGVLMTRRGAETRHLRRLVEQALRASASGGAASGRGLVTRPSGSRPYVVSVMAAPRTERFLAGDSIACVIHIQDLSLQAPSRESLRAVFGLSAREADLAVELVRCGSLERAAAAAGMAYNTARNHLQGVAMKTGARGQTEIVTLLARLA